MLAPLRAAAAARDTGQAMSKPAAKVTLQSIADAVGVSRMTVSNAFSRPDQLSPELRDRILKVAGKLGYSGPDPAARALARGRTGAVGLLLNDKLSEAFADAVSAEFLAAVGDTLSEHGLALTLLTHPVQESEYNPARDVAMDGVLVYTCTPSTAGMEWLAKRALPTVAVDQHVADGVPTINIDDRSGARAAAEHLVGLGHRRVGILTLQPDDPEADPDDNFPSQQRVLGWTEPLRAAGIDPIVVASTFTPTSAAYEAALDLLQREDRPTAVLCFSDMFARGVLRAAETLGLRVPDDLSVVGFDDNPLAATSHPPLTTVRQDVTAKGRAAVEALLATMDDRPPEPIVLPTELVVRDSTAPPPG